MLAFFSIRTVPKLIPNRPTKSRTVPEPSPNRPRAAPEPSHISSHTILAQGPEGHARAPIGANPSGTQLRTWLPLAHASGATAGALDGTPVTCGCACQLRGAPRGRSGWRKRRRRARILDQVGLRSVGKSTACLCCGCCGPAAAAGRATCRQCARGRRAAARATCWAPAAAS